jgi:primase-polymerase (primpol)-like protein
MSTVLPLPDYQKLPKLLQQYPAWTLWRYQDKGRAKQAKVPLSPKTFRNCNPFVKPNQLSLQAALDLASPRGLGVGVVLTGEPIEIDGKKQHLIGLDFDNCENKMNDLKALWRWLDKPYMEVSPSGNGLRMFALCLELLPGGNSGEGRELYSAGRFLTVTGDPGLGTITDQTDKLAALHDKWFPKKTASVINVADHSFPEISADCPYEQYRNICWGIFSTGWDCAYDIAKDWSMTAPHRYEEKTLDLLYRTFDFNRARRPSVGTIFYCAKHS